MYSPQITPFQPSNIDATTKMLMGLQQKGQLQQYVAQHKNDPNLVALALYVSNMSKARPAVQAEANQPKIVDQAIAGMAPQEMMPEDQGIATLPAPNMQNMAGGGIVAFDDGGEVPGYAGGVFTGPGTPEDYRAYAMQRAAKLGLNPVFVDRIFKIESGYDPLAKSESGSTGIGQLVKSTARYYGLKTGKQDERLNPIMNINASLAHMVDLNKKYKGDPELIAVAYNQGEPTLDAHLRKNGGNLVPENLQQEIATKLKAKGKLTDTQIAARAVEPVKYLAKLNAEQIPTAQSLAPNEELVQPTQAADNSVPTNYKQEQASQQALYNADVKKMQKEGFVDTAARVGRGLVGYGEAGLNLAGQLTGYPMGALYGVGSNILTGKNKDVGKQMEDYVRDVSYDPRTPEGQEINALKNKFLSNLPAYIGKVSGAKPTKAAGKGPITEPGITALTDSPAAKAVEATAPAPVKPQALGAQMELFPQESMPATAPRTSAAPALPIQQAPKTPLQLAQEKQIAARAGLTALPGADSFVGPKLPINLTPENLAVRAAAAERLQGKTPVAKPTTGKAFEITPESAEIAAQARARLANQKAAAPLPSTEPIAPTEPAVSKALGMSPDEMLYRALEAEKKNRTGINAISKENVGNAILPGAALAVPAGIPQGGTEGAGVADLVPNERIGESVFDPTFGGKMPLPVDKAAPKGITAAETPKDPVTGGTDWNRLMLQMGLHLMAGKSPNLMTNIGEAGLGALGMQQAEEKAKSESEFKKMQSRYYGSYADAIERGAKEKNEVLQAETLVQQHMEKWLSSGPGLIASSQDPNATAKEEARFRKSVYLQLGLSPIMSSNTPAGGAKFLGFENPA